MGKGRLLGKMGGDMKVNGLMIKGMDKVFLGIRMGGSLRKCGEMGR
jgi:hypothetical protein